MEKEKVKEMPPDLKRGWEQVNECCRLLAAHKANIAEMYFNGKIVKYTRPNKNWSEMIEEKELVVGNYKVKQPCKNLLAIVYLPERRLVYQSVVSHWMNENELMAVFKFFLSENPEE